MNCQRFEEVVNDIAREQIIEAGTREAALGHTGECERCAKRLDDERAITLRLRDLVGQMDHTGASARVEARLLAALDEFAPSQLPAPAPTSVTQYRSRYLIGAIAAGLLIVSGLSVIRWRQPVLVNRATKTVAGVPTPTGPIASASPIPVKSSVGPDDSPRKSSNRNKAGAPATIKPATPGKTEIATDFLPLTYGAATNLEEGGRMVRVDLPHSAMATFGLPVNMDRAGERVKADVLFGVDGVAHAIRFVR